MVAVLQLKVRIDSSIGEVHVEQQVPQQTRVLRLAFELPDYVLVDCLALGFDPLLLGACQFLQQFGALQLLLHLQGETLQLLMRLSQQHVLDLQKILSNFSFIMSAKSI